MEVCSQSLVRVSSLFSNVQTKSSSLSGGGAGLSFVRLPIHATAPVRGEIVDRRSGKIVRRESVRTRAYEESEGIAQAPSSSSREEEGARVRRIHTVKDFDAALKKAGTKLVVVEYATTGSSSSQQIYPAVVSLSRTCQDVEFLLVMGDECEDTRTLCSRAGVKKVPHFVFYKNQEKIHEEKMREEQGIDADILTGDVLYYGDSDVPVRHLKGAQELEAFLSETAKADQLGVVDVGLKHCGPCVKVYPTVIKLANNMKGSVVFARMQGDENPETVQFMKKMKVVEVPTFLFFKEGKLCGRYVGSGKGDLIGEILRYQGVRVTY